MARITATFPAGDYYIGDPCYLINDEWDEFLHWLGGEGRAGTWEGRRVACGHTNYGDGLYMGTDGWSYGVDSGMIACVQCPDGEMASHKFETPFEVEVTGDGVFSFGGVRIDTRPEASDIGEDSDGGEEE